MDTSRRRSQHMRRALAGLCCSSPTSYTQLSQESALLRHSTLSAVPQYFVSNKHRPLTAVWQCHPAPHTAPACRGLPHRVAPEEVLVGDGRQRDRLVLDLQALLCLHSLNRPPTNPSGQSLDCHGSHGRQMQCPQQHTCTRGHGEGLLAGCIAAALAQGCFHVRACRTCQAGCAALQK